jgi:CRISPR-associated protein Csb2
MAGEIQLSRCVGIGSQGFNEAPAQWPGKSRPQRPGARSVPRNGDDPTEVLRRDAVAECRRRGLPTPEIELLEYSGGTRFAARLRFSFAVEVSGPIVLGRDSHQGGSLFTTASCD